MIISFYSHIWVEMADHKVFVEGGYSMDHLMCSSRDRVLRKTLWMQQERQYNVVAPAF